MHNESGKGAEGRLDVLANDATSHRQGQIARCAVLLREANIDCVGIEDAGLLMVMIK